MRHVPSRAETLSPWWKHGVILILVLGFTVLIALTVKTYNDAPPIPERVEGPSGETIFLRDDLLAGQQVFLKYGLMENGTIWGHGGYLGPDFSAEYLHTLTRDTREFFARERFKRSFADLDTIQRRAIAAGAQQLLKENRYDPQRQILRFTSPEVSSFQSQLRKWGNYFSAPGNSAGLPEAYVEDPAEIRRLVAFFAWTAWASVANRPGAVYSYTNNFPFDPDVGNAPTSHAVLWSALSLVGLLGGTALALFAFGRFGYLGWKGAKEHAHPKDVPLAATPSQRATLHYFALATLLLLVEVLVGGATAHYRADPDSFYGMDLSHLLPSHLLRTWHVQLAIFWIATAYVAGGLLLAPALGRREPRGQVIGVNGLLVVLTAVILGSLFGEWLGLNQSLASLWFWLGHQGWEYLDLGRAWQVLLAIGLLGWVILLMRSLAPAALDPERREMASLFLYVAVAIPLFYVPAMFFTSTTHFSVVDAWRFWIIHLWVEGFLELFVTVLVAVMFYELGLVSHLTAARIVYLDAVLFLGSGIVGTAHHWYWTGQSPMAMALGAMFSALEVVPLTLLTLDAWDFIRLSRVRCDVCGTEMRHRHRWTFLYLMAVGFWNFLGAGVFGFLINLPIVSYFEVGTMLTPNHGHAAMMGVFGMLAIALLVFALRELTQADVWQALEGYIRLSFWGLNLGLFMMVVVYFIPGGLLQLWAVLTHGYWYARSPDFVHQPVMRLLEWLRLPADLIFIGLGVVPLVLAMARIYLRPTKAFVAGQRAG